MRKMTFATLVAIMFAFMSVLSVPAVRAGADESAPLRCTIDLSVDVAAANPHWEGPITGAVEGTMQLWEHWSENYVVGATEHFFEDFVIYTSDGSVIKGNDQGIWTFQTLKFRSQGFVTEATGDWAFLVGYRVLTTGFTSEFPPVPPSTVISGWGTVMMVPP